MRTFAFMNSKRQEKVAQLIREELSELFRKQASESGIKGTLVTVTHTKITSDLQDLFEYFS